MGSWSTKLQPCTSEESCQSDSLHEILNASVEQSNVSICGTNLTPMKFLEQTISA